MINRLLYHIATMRNTVTTHVVCGYRTIYRGVVNLCSELLYSINPSQVRQLHGHSPMALSPTPRALRSTSEPSEELREAHCGQTVVGVDFGMSSCSMSYRINNADPVESVELAPGCSTIPTVLLLSKPDGHNCRVKSYIGEVAKENKNRIPDRKLNKFHYFELNMLLYRHKVSILQWSKYLDVVMRENEREGMGKRGRGGEGVREGGKFKEDESGRERENVGRKEKG